MKNTPVAKVALKKPLATATPKKSENTTGSTNSNASLVSSIAKVIEPEVYIFNILSNKFYE